MCTVQKDAMDSPEDMRRMANTTVANLTPSTQQYVHSMDNLPSKCQDKTWVVDSRM